MNTCGRCRYFKRDVYSAYPEHTWVGDCLLVPYRPVTHRAKREGCQYFIFNPKPEPKDKRPDLSGCEHVVFVENGQVKEYVFGEGKE